MLRARERLPIWSMREEVVRLVEENTVIVLSGATGSGKSTQLPQFLLDHYIEGGRGSQVNILVTQPRRISAISLCERVAAERCVEVGRDVGYSIRLEARVSDSTALTFVTTGLLLRRLQEDPDLQGVSHVVIDEVHEVGWGGGVVRSHGGGGCREGSEGPSGATEQAIHDSATFLSSPRTLSSATSIRTSFSSSCKSCWSGGRD